MKMQICKAHTEITPNHHPNHCHRRHPTFVRCFVRSLICIVRVCEPTLALCHSFHLPNKWGTFCCRAHSTVCVRARSSVFISFIIASDFKELMLPFSISPNSTSTFCLSLIVLVICHLIADQQMFEHL